MFYRILIPDFPYVASLAFLPFLSSNSNNMHIISDSKTTSPLGYFVWYQIHRKSTIAIQIWFDLTRFRYRWWFIHLIPDRETTGTPNHRVPTLKKKSYLLSEKLASLGIKGPQLEGPHKPVNTIVRTC